MARVFILVLGDLGSSYIHFPGFVGRLVVSEIFKQFTCEYVVLVLWSPSGSRRAGCAPKWESGFGTYCVADSVCPPDAIPSSFPVPTAPARASV